MRNRAPTVAEGVGRARELPAPVHRLHAVATRPPPARPPPPGRGTPPQAVPRLAAVVVPEPRHDRHLLTWTRVSAGSLREVPLRGQVRPAHPAHEPPVLDHVPLAAPRAAAEGQGQGEAAG